MPEQLGILLLFLVVLLFNLVGGFLTRRRERESARTEDAPPAPPPRVARPSPPALPPRVAPPSPPLVRSLPRVNVSPPPTRRVRRVTWSAMDLRHAIVIMTVLGPPRGLIDEHRDVR
jgi:hypothetical protein